MFMHYFALALVLAAGLGYHMVSRGVPDGGNRFIGVGMAYVVGFIICMICFLFIKQGSLAQEWQACLLFRRLPGRRCVLPLPAHTGHNRGSGHYGSSSGQGTVCAAYAPAGDGYPVFPYGRWKVCPSSGIPAWPGTVNRFRAGADSGI